MLPSSCLKAIISNMAGSSSEQAASRTLLLTSLMSLLVIFLLLYNEFKNAKESGVILLNLPLALIGACLS